MQPVSSWEAGRSHLKELERNHQGEVGVSYNSGDLQEASSAGGVCEGVHV